MRVSNIIIEGEGATLTLGRMRTGRIVANWEGPGVNRGESWSNRFSVNTVPEVHAAANEILIIYHGERADEMGVANVSSDALFAFGLKLLELGRS